MSSVLRLTISRWMPSPSTSSTTRCSIAHRASRCSGVDRSSPRGTILPTPLSVGGVRAARHVSHPAADGRSSSVRLLLCW